MRRIAAAAPLLAWALAAWADPPSPDKSEFTLFDPTPDALLRAFSTDRPPKANSPYTVDAGRFQYETDLAVFGRGNADGVLTRDWTIIDPTLKLGLTNTVDAELQVTPYQSAASSGAPTVSGQGDSVARLKWNVLGDDGGDVAAALIPYVKLPTARSGLGNGRVEGGLIVPVSIAAPAGLTVIVMPEADVLKNAANDGYHGAFDFLVNVSHPIDARWTGYAEIFASRDWQGGERPVYTLDCALTFAITPTLQWDLGNNLSLNGVAPRVQVYSGLSQRF